MKKKDKSKKIFNRLNRIEGQVRGVSKMLDSHKDINDVFIQISAIKSALASVENLLIEKNCDEIESMVAHDIDPHLISEELKKISKLLKSKK